MTQKAVQPSITRGVQQTQKKMSNNKIHYFQPHAMTDAPNILASQRMCVVKCLLTAGVCLTKDEVRAINEQRCCCYKTFLGRVHTSPDHVIGNRVSTNRHLDWKTDHTMLFGVFNTVSGARGGRAQHAVLCWRDKQGKTWKYDPDTNAAAPVGNRHAPLDLSTAVYQRETDLGEQVAHTIDLT